ncbi:MAG: hypothetical protein N2318_03485 [Meiothermus sp.]|uniref:hypothetical protein n=1 Tax=Meiothermus TaxID=65551 RepID=UPI0021DEE1C9|nr:hypothetical protein [Meiothermus sp.]MCX7782689.1 hypothetical protein [Meiothermus sp.]GIW25770.1 MAG: hypothetical protein KatS3mg069_2037 [Meiothermus sp.]
MPPVLVMQWIAAALVAKFAAPYFGINLDVFRPPSPPPGQPQQPVTNSSTPPKSGPSTGSTLRDFVNQPVSVLGVAAITFASVFLVAQIRAAGRDAANSLKETTSALSNPEGAVKVK